ncbi:hypothetical protein L1987_66761 [Smallanthus sonchifolius]|uniref:Uncharacterized protein n=1 Tax=Smallanthus sonchifolius TaxID=185202 RepID=A0ACB9BYD7_9ASTR|nr:hypothetical protein L1987_66761 [Smallanthus sonchifolius]
MGWIQSLIVVSFVFVLVFPVGKTETDDVIEALVDFMQKLVPGTMQNKPNWGWNMSSDPCLSHWHGVTCDKSNQTVKNIVLEHLNFLQQEISNCKRLKLLYLNQNHFSGNLPDSLSDLTSLVRIDISNNELSGNLPDMSRNTGLLSFLAQNNRLTGQLPNFNYQLLEDFDVSNNDFTGQIPDDTGRFGAKSFTGSPPLCGKVLSNACPQKKKKKDLHDLLIYSGYAILGLIVLVLIVLLFLNKKENLEDYEIGSNASTKKGVNSTKDSGISSESKTGQMRSEFSTTSVENGGFSASLVVLSSPVEVVNGMRFEDLLRAPAELIGRGKHGSVYKVHANGGIALVVKRIKDWEISRVEFKKRMHRIDQVRHPKVLPVVAYYCSKQEKLMVYDFQQNGSLFKLLQGSQNGQILDWGSRLNIAFADREACSENEVDLAKWVNSVVKGEWTGEVFDKALVVEGASEERMVGLLRIALKCINDSHDLRPGMDQVVTMIVSLKEEEERSMASSDP